MGRRLRRSRTFSPAGSKHWKKRFQPLEKRPTLFPRFGKSWRKVPALGTPVMKNLSQWIEAWGQKSLGEIIRDWWRIQFPEPAGPRYPWSDEEQTAVNQPEAVRVCHRCLTPQDHLGWFCPECGSATGPYNNCMPFIHIWSQGETLRAGVNEKIRFARWVYPAYFLAGLSSFFIFAPIYWVWLIRAQIKRTELLSSIDYETEN